MRNALVATALTAALTLQACSSRPREFSPHLASVPADQQAFEAAHAECRQLLADGKLDSNGMLASTGAGAAAGVTTMAVGAGAAATAGGIGGFALASATVVALPFAMVGGAYWMAKSKRNKKERRIQQATAGCLVQRGFPIVGWEPTKKRKARAAKQQGAAQGHSD